MQPINRTPARIALLASAILLLSACGTANETSGDEPGALTVVATTTILGDVARNVVGSDADVIVLTPVGADPHDFQASAAQVAEINRADLVIANGLHLEEGLDDVLDAAAADGVRVIRVAPMLDPIPFGGESGHDEDHDEDDDAHEGDEPHEGDDPHVWFDPLRMGEAARVIARELGDVAPGLDWLERAEAYAAELAAADDEIVTMLASIPPNGRRLVTVHNSFGYFADRYAFEVIGTVIPAGSTLADPSSEELADLVAAIEREGVNVIFAETTQPTDLAEAVAAELGKDVRVVSLYTGSLDQPGSPADTLIGMLLTNASRIAEALQ